MTSSEIISNSIALAALTLSIYTFYKQRTDRKPKLKIDLDTRLRSYFDGTDDRGFSKSTLKPVQCLIVSNPTESDIFIEKINFVINKNTVHLIQDFTPSEKVMARRNIEVELNEFNFGETSGYFVVQDANGNNFKSKMLRLDHNHSNF